MTDPDRYHTLSGRSEAALSVGGSEFVGYAAHARSVDDAEALLAAVRDAHEDATHVVSAYRVRGTPFGEYADDDGEPLGSAGEPVLSVLQGRDLENVVVAVARYFGGTLGVGGLVQAYSETASAAVDAGEVIEERPHERLAVVVDYDDTGTVRGVLESEAVDFDADRRRARHVRGPGPTRGGGGPARSPPERDRWPRRRRAHVGGGGTKSTCSSDGPRPGSV